MVPLGSERDVAVPSTAYTVPIARSPFFPRINKRVISGSVMPAQNVAGSITTRQMK